jgi:hypothetical protein
MVPGEFPVVADVRVTRVQQGRGQHAMLVCPRCRRGRRELFAVERALVCRVCGGVRTRQQLAKNRRDWQTGGRALEDDLLRASARVRGRPNRARRIVLIADALARLDSERARGALELAAEALGESPGGPTRWQVSRRDSRLAAGSSSGLDVPRG